MKKKIITLTESDLHKIIKEIANKIVTEIFPNNTTTVLYHKSPISCRKSILKNGLLPSVGDSYKAHWDDEENLTPYIFLYDHNTINGGEYDSTYDDDIYAIDISKLDKKHLHKDPDTSMRGCFVYDLPIPTSFIKLIYKGSEGDSDERLMAKHSHIYESIDNSNIKFDESKNDYGFDIGVYSGENLMGYLTIEIHDYESLESEIYNVTDSYDVVDDVFNVLNKWKPIVELSNIGVNKEFRRMGVSKMLLEYVLNKYNNYQFFMRVEPTDGPDMTTLANSVKKYGFVEITDNYCDNDYSDGIFLVKR